MDELITYATMFRLRRWQWAGIRAASRRCYVEATLRSRSLERRRDNLGATIATMTQLQWIARITVRSEVLHSRQTYKSIAKIKIQNFLDHHLRMTRTSVSVGKRERGNTCAVYYSSFLIYVCTICTIVTHRHTFVIDDGVKISRD